MSEESTVYEALQLLQNKTLDDVILESVLLHDSSQDCLVISLPNIVTKTLKEYLIFRKICTEIYNFGNKFSEEKKKNTFSMTKNLKGENVVTMRFVTINDHDFARMSPWLVTYIKKMFYDGK